MHTYDLEQTAELIEAARGKRIFSPDAAGGLGGLRRGEIAALRWRHVDLAAGQLAVLQSAEQTKAGVRYKEPKSGRGRTVALSATVVSRTEGPSHSSSSGASAVGKRLSDDDFVVTQEDGLAFAAA